MHCYDEDANCRGRGSAMIEAWRDLRPDEILEPGDRVYSPHLGRWVTIEAGDWGAGLSQAGAWAAPQRKVRAAPQPLTQNQMIELIPDWPIGCDYNRFCTMLGRAVERAHGIGCDVEEKQ